MKPRFSWGWALFSPVLEKPWVMWSEELNLSFIFSSLLVKQQQESWVDLIIHEPGILKWHCSFLPSNQKDDYSLPFLRRLRHHGRLSRGELKNSCMKTSFIGRWFYLDSHKKGWHSEHWDSSLNLVLIFLKDEEDKASFCYPNILYL